MRKIFNILLLACFISTAVIHADDEVGSFSIGADWIYWKVEQQKMQIGATGVVTDNTHLKLKVLKPDFEYSNGFKVFAGYTTQDQLWNTTLTLTHIPSAASLKLSEEEELRNFSVFTGENYSFTEAFKDINMRWNATINYLDFDVERRLVFCDDLEIVPHIGIRGQWICQKAKISSDIPSFSAKFNNELRGIGVEGGCWGSWNLPWGVAVVGHFGGSLVYSKVHNTMSVPSDIAETITFDAPSYTSNAWVDSFLGIVYSRSFDCFVVNFHAGWEHHLIMNTNHFSAFSSGDGDMTMQGLTLGASVEF